MRIEWQIGFWIGAFLLLVLLLWLFSGVLLPFAAALALGYLLNPVVDRLEKLGFNRLGATLLIMTWLALILVLISVLILPVLWRQLASFIEAFPSYAITLEELISDKAERLSRDYGGILIEKLGLGNKSRPRARKRHQRSHCPGHPMGGVVSEFAFNARRGADQPYFAPCRHSRRRLLHASRLGEDAHDDRWACAAASPGDGARACARDRQRPWRDFCAANRLCVSFSAPGMALAIR